MITFKQFLNETRYAPLYHATAISKARLALADGGLMGKTLHLRYKLLTTGGKGEFPGTQQGISTTRSFNFASGWDRVVFELDQEKVRSKYRIIPINYWSNQNNKARVQGDKHFHNEFEEFVILENNKKIPLNMVKQIYFILPRQGDIGYDAFKAQFDKLKDEFPNYKYKYVHDKF